MGFARVHISDLWLLRWYRCASSLALWRSLRCGATTSNQVLEVRGYNIKSGAGFAGFAGYLNGFAASNQVLNLLGLLGILMGLLGMFNGFAGFFFFLFLFLNLGFGSVGILVDSGGTVAGRPKG